VGFRGCFIGVDRYASDRIMQLSSAVRDAEALHALFTDNLGSGADLLCDAEATAGAVRAALTGLQTSTEDDIVVVGFSGHGSSTHQLVTHDADPDDLAGFCAGPRQS
jgi:ATP-dependent DNA helicase